MRHDSSSNFRRRGFTLIELMISIAIILFLMYGINKVFTATSDTVGAGQALSALTRDQKAAQAVLQSDFQGMTTVDTPCIVLTSLATPAFLDKADEQNHSDGSASPNPLVYVDNLTTTTFKRFNYNFRNHRTDHFSFFSRGSFQRQTGDGTAGQIVSSGASNEAWIVYGYLNLANNLSTPSYYGPADDDKSSSDKNDNNQYASQWALGRMAMLLSPTTTTGVIKSGSTPLGPLSPTSPADKSPWTIQDSRFDVAQTSISQFRADLISFMANPSSGLGSDDWWSYFFVNRFNAMPYFDKDMPIEDASALMAPIFLSGCGQFMVEYAGDFLSQNADGTLAKDGGGNLIDGPDGQTDFFWDKSADSGDSTKWVRRIRWYGLPRNVNTGDDTSGTLIHGGASTGDINSLIDVVPLRDVRKAGGFTGAAAAAPFEKVVPTASDNYADETTAGGYVCAWGPGDPQPKLWRITITLNDPDGRLNQGQTYEYVLGPP